MEYGYRIGELSEKTGVTKRTVHYYVGKGLIPPPEGSGVNSAYNDGHLKRILLVKKLQDRYLPLERIREIMASLSDNEVEAQLNSVSESTESAKSISQVMESPWTEIQSETAFGKEYVRVDLGQGLELHCPADSQDEYRGIILNLKNYAKKLLEER